MKSFRAGEIVLLKYPFTSGTQVKRRPALVLLDIGDNDLLLARITSRPPQSKYDVEIREWRSAGLFTTSIVRTVKLVTLEKTLVERKLGKLNRADWSSVRQMVQEIARLL